MTEHNDGDLAEALVIVDDLGFGADVDADQAVLGAAEAWLNNVDDGLVTCDEVLLDDVRDAVSWIVDSGNNFGDDVDNDATIRRAAVLHLEWENRRSLPNRVLVYGAWRDDENRFDTLTLFSTAIEAQRYIESMTADGGDADEWDVAELPIYTFAVDVPDERRV